VTVSAQGGNAVRIDSYPRLLVVDFLLLIVKQTIAGIVMSIAICNLTVEIMIEYCFLGNVFYNGDFFSFIF